MLTGTIILLIVLVLFIIAFAINKYINREKVIRDKGHVSYYRNGKMHREDGPAFYSKIGSCQEWYQNGICTRLDGPAIEWPSGNKSWFINNRKFTKNEFNSWVKRVNRICQKY